MQRAAAAPAGEGRGGLVRRGADMVVWVFDLKVKGFVRWLAGDGTDRHGHI